MSGFKKIFGAVIKWLQKNWLLVLIVMFLGVLFAKGCERTETYNSLFEHYRQQNKEYQQQLEALRSVQETERIKLNQQLQNYFDNMNRIEEEYKEEIKRIESRREGKRVKIINDYDKNPETLTKVINEVFGIPVE